MHRLPDIVAALWGRLRAPRVAGEYRQAFDGRALVLRDLAMFCNAAAPIAAPSEFERGVEEGKRRVWLHIVRMCGLAPSDLVTIADGGNKDD